MRVVSLLPSATEIVHALGHGSELVGRSAECDYPSEVVALPVVMRPRTLDADRPSREIDRRVRSARAANESLYELDLDRLRSLRPDLIVTQDLCAVCSVTSDEVRAACRQVGASPTILSIGPRRLGEVWESIETIGRALGDPSGAERLVRDLRARVETPPGRRVRRVAVVEWLDPPILAGLWAPDVVTAAGGVPAGPEPGAPGVRTDWPSIAADRPDVVILSPCSFSVRRTERELGDSAVRGAVRSLRPTLGTFVADEAYFSRPGPRLADGVELVRGLLAGLSGAPPWSVVRWSGEEREGVPA